MRITKRNSNPGADFKRVIKSRGAPVKKKLHQGRRLVAERRRKREKISLAALKGKYRDLLLKTKANLDLESAHVFSF